MEAPPLQRKLAAILAADVVGYSRLMHQDEERTLARLTALRAVVDGLIVAANGTIFGTAGDSVLAEFPSVVEAFHCAVAIQQALAQEEQAVPDAERMQLRIGINVGDVMVKEGDIFGDGVNIAARLESLAEPGGICVTRGVRDHLRDLVDAGFEDLREQSVKNIPRPVRVFRVIFDRSAAPSLPKNGRRSAAARAAADPHEDPAEIAFWQSVQASDDDDEYRLYLQHYPNGTFADLARRRLEDEDEDAEREAADVELAFWNSVQASDDDEEYRIYLQRYPDGAFADLAKARLEGISSAEDAEVELAFWETVRDSNDPAMVQAYVEKYPRGEFKALAEILLRKLRQPAA